MIVKLLTELHLEFLSLKGGCRCLSESTLVKMSNCWKCHAAAQHMFWLRNKKNNFLLHTLIWGADNPPNFPYQTYVLDE